MISSNNGFDEDFRHGPTSLSDWHSGLRNPSRQNRRKSLQKETGSFVVDNVKWGSTKGIVRLLSKWFYVTGLLALLTNCLIAQTVVVFTNNFDGTIPPEISPGAAFLTGVQGYANLGPSGNQFGGKFLRSPTGNLVTLILSNLPPHKALNISMLFAAIDSLDGTGTYPQGDFSR